MKRGFLQLVHRQLRLIKKCFGIVQFAIYVTFLYQLRGNCKEGQLYGILKENKFITEKGI